jgi:hypothetical protein
MVVLEPILQVVAVAVGQVPLVQMVHLLLVVMVVLELLQPLLDFP